MIAAAEPAASAAVEAPSVTAGGATEGAAHRHEEAREAVREVLADPRFSDASWQKELLAWVNDRLGVVGDALEALPAWTWWLILVALSLTAVAILVHLAWTLLAFADRPGGRLRHRPSRAPLVGESRPAARDLIAEAASLEAAGRGREALRRLHLAGLLALDEAGLLTFRPEKTDRDYLAELAAKPQEEEGAVRDLMLALTRRIERHVYGGRALPADVLADARRDALALAGRAAA